MTLHLVELVPSPEGGEPTTFVIRRDGGSITVEARGATGPWQVRVGVAGSVHEGDGILRLTL